MKNRIVTGIIVLIMSLGLVACSTSNTKAPSRGVQIEPMDKPDALNSITHIQLNNSYVSLSYIANDLQVLSGELKLSNVLYRSV